MKFKTFILTFLMMMSCSISFGQGSLTGSATTEAQLWMHLNDDEIGTISLANDIKITATCPIPNGKKVTIDLNGHKLFTEEEIYIINNEGKLTITDNSEGKTGTISSTLGIYNGVTPTRTSVTDVKYDRVLTINGGVFNSSSKNGNAATIYNYRGVIKINGGEFYGEHSAITNYGMATIANAYIECLNRDNGAAAIINDYEITYGENVNIVGIYTTVTGTAYTTGTKPTYLFAELKNGPKYPSLQAALDACTTGDNTINLLFHNSDNATVSQKEGVNITIDGNGYKGKQFEYTGTIYVNGNSRHTGTETLTIQDVNFVTTDNEHDFISCNDGGDPVIRYAHNVTVQDCNFTATEGSTAVVALRFRQSYNINVKDSEFTNLHSAMWATGTSGIAFDNIKATNCKEGGISFGTSTPVYVKNSTIAGAQYGVRADGSGDYRLTVESSTLEAEVPVIVRNTTGEYKLTVENNATLTATSGGPQVVVTADSDNKPYVVPTSNVNVTLYDNVTSTFGLTAKIGNAFYATLQDAVDNAKDDDEIVLVSDVTEDVTITQKADLDLIIAGAGKKFTGVMTVFGDARHDGNETLTIKDINFVAKNGSNACILSPDRTAQNPARYSYSHNVTVENCSFTDVDGNVNCAAIRHGDGGDVNWTLNKCTVDNTMHSLIQTNNVNGKLVIAECTVNSKNGVNLNSCTNVEMTGCNFNVQGYALRSGVSSGGNLGEEKRFVLNNNTLKSACGDGDAVIMFRASSVDANFSMKENVVSGTTHISGNTADTKISADENYWDGKEAPVVAEGSAPIVVNSYYSDATLSTLVRNEMGSIYAFVSSDRIFGDVTTNAEESIKIEIIGKDGNPIGTSSLEKTEHATGFNKQLTWRINLGTDDSGSWAMEWNEGAPSINNMPAKVKLYVDAKEGDAAVAEAEIKYTANGDGESPVFAAKTNANGKINSFIACTGEFNLSNANTFLNEALTEGDNVAILTAGTYDVPTGKDLTITGAVNDVQFGPIGTPRMDGNYTFNNVTFNYAADSHYKGLQYAGDMVYNNCTFNGQVFLYGNKETFNNCTFNQENSGYYNVWTYSAKEVAFNECTFNSAGKSVLVYNEGACATDLTVTDTKFFASATVDDKAAIEIDCSLMPKGTSIVINGVDEGKTTATGFGTNTKSGSSLWNDKKVVEGAPNGGTSSKVIIDDVVVKEPALMNLAGGGTEENPYLISNLEDLIWFRYQVNAGENNYAGKHVKLADNIDLNNEEWTPIGNVTYDSKYKPADASKVFSGVFNGNGKVISNLKVASTVGGADTQANVGFFGITGEGAVIKDLTLTNVNIETDGRNVGALAGFAYKATLSNITVNGNIQIKGGNNVSGVAGMTRYYDMSATNIKVIGNDGSAIVGNNIVGGIFAEIAPNGSVQTFESLSVENVAITGASGVGGIVGLLTTGAVDNVSVKNVVLTGRTDYKIEDIIYPMGRIRLGSVAGLMGGKYATIANVTTENVTAKNLDGDAVVLPIIGANYDASSNATEAKIGDTYYATLQTAIDKANNGETIELLANVNNNVTFTAVSAKELTLDLNGYTITSEDNSTITVSNGNHVIIEDSSEPSTGMIKSTAENCEAIAVKDNGNVTFVSGTAYHPVNGVYLYTAGDNNKFTMTGGTIKVNDNGMVLTVSTGEATVKDGNLLIENMDQGGISALAFNGTINIEGGNISNIAKVETGWEGKVSITGGTFTFANNETFVKGTIAPFHYAVENENGTFTVIKNDVVLNGTGVENDPYLISNVNELMWFRDYVNLNGTEVHAALANDIDMSDLRWVSIGTSDKKFTGTFDGRDYTLSNLNADDNECGLFRYTHNATVKNLTIENVTVIEPLQDHNGTGAVIGVGSGTTRVENITVKGKIAVAGKRAGAIVGYVYSGLYAENCHVIGSGIDESYVNAFYWASGGIIGFSAPVDGHSEIKNCSVKDIKIWAEHHYGAGAIAGTFKGLLEDVTAENVNVIGKYSEESNGLLCGYQKATGNSYAINSTLTVGDAVIENPRDIVAKIGDNKMFCTLEAAATVSQNGETIQLIWAEGNDPIAMAATFVGNKTVTITGTADVDWDKGWLYVGRNGEGDGHVIFKNANLTSTSVGVNNNGIGLNVSCKKEGSSTTNDGEVEIINSNIQLDYLIGKGNIKLDNSTLNVYEGFAVGARPASETGGVQRTVTMDITNGSNVIVKNHNGQGLGYESKGIMNIDATSTFETTQAFLITADGTMNNAGTVEITGTLTNNGTINFTDDAATLATTTGGLTINYELNPDKKVVYVDGVYKVVEKVYVAQIGDVKFESLQEAIDAVAEGETVKLMADVTITEPAYGQNALNHARAINFTLDLNGKTLSADTGNSVFRFNISGSGATDDVTVTIKNGTVVSGANTWCTLMSSGISADVRAVMNLEDLVIENNKGDDFAVKAWANGVVNAEGVTINSTYGGGFYALGGEITLDDCTVNQKGLWKAPYNSMAVAVSNGGKMTVNSGTYSAAPLAATDGNNQGTSHGSWTGGVMSSGGTLIIKGGTFSNGNIGGTATYPRELFIVGADADYGDNVNGQVIIKGGTFTSIGDFIHCETIWGSENDAANDYMPTMGVTITAGDFTAVAGKTIGGCDPVSTGNPVDVEISGGTYGANHAIYDSYLVVGYSVVDNEDGTYSVVEDQVAKIGDVTYKLLHEAFNAAQDGDEIVVLEDITYTKANGYVNGDFIDGLVYTGDKSFTVNFDGHTITDNGDINDYLVYLNNKSEESEKDNEITFKNGTIAINAERNTTAWAAITVGANSARYETTLNLNDMKVVNGNPENANNQVIRTRKGATVNLNNKTVVTSNGTSYGVVAETDGTVNINSGAKVVQQESGTTSGNEVYTAVSGNGTINIYDGATIESDNYAIHNMTSGNTVINIYGGTIKADEVAVHVATNGGNGESAVAYISGGTFTGVLEAETDAASIVITGGIFSVNPIAYCADNYGAFPYDENSWVVREISGEQTFELTAGWNWVSSYISEFDTDGLTWLKEDLSGQVGAQIKNNLHAVTKYEQGWFGSLTNVSVKEMYKVKATADITFTHEGSYVNYDVCEIVLYPGWNYISYPVNEEMNLIDALAKLQPSSNDIIKRQDATATYAFGAWRSAFTLTPGQGYMYKNASDEIKSFYYTTKKTTSTDSNNRSSKYWTVDATQYPSNMTMIAMTDVEGGDYEVAAFVNGELRGSSRPVYVEELNAHILILTISGDEVAEVTFKYYDIATGEEVAFSNRINYSNDAVVGSMAEPYMLTRGTTGIGEASLSEINIYPNPTTTGTEINLQATCDKVEVFNALGVKVAEYQNVDTIDALETAGIYVIRITNDSNVQNCRLVVK